MVSSGKKTVVDLGGRLQALRLGRGGGMTQAALARKLGVAVSTYTSWESGKFAPRVEQLVALADLYGVSLDVVCGRASDDAGSITVRDITWRLAWSRQSSGSERGAEIWARLVGGDSHGKVTRELKISSADLQRQVQNLVLDEGLVVESVARDAELEQVVQESFTNEVGEARLRDVWVGKLDHIEWPFVRYVLLGHLAKEHFRAEVQPGNTVGLCGGFAVSRLVHALRRGECPPGIRVFPVAATPVFEKAPVSANGVTSALAYRHFDYGVQGSELPFVPEYAERAAGTRNLPSARIAKRILEDAARVDFVFMGIGGRNTGALAQDISDLQRSYQYLAQVDLDQIREQQQHVGDILYHLVDARGDPLHHFRPQNERLVCSIGLVGLRRLVDGGSRVVVIASGREKADVVRAAIGGGYINVLIVDDGLARELVGESEGAPR